MAAKKGVSRFAGALHKDDMARIEVPLHDLPRFLNLELRYELISAFCAFGFKFVTIDLAGFRSGSLNSIIPAEDLLREVSRPMHKSAL